MASTFVRNVGTSLLLRRSIKFLSSCNIFHYVNYRPKLLLSDQVAIYHSLSKVHSKYIFRINFSTDSKEEKKSDEELEQDKFKSKKWNLIQRFKESYAIYGKIMIITHGILSVVWFGSLCAVAYNGFNLLDVFEKYNFPNWMKTPLKYGGETTNMLATAVVLYKCVSPLRYLLTLIVTRSLVHYMRCKGKAPKMDEKNRLRNLAREGAKLSRDRFKFRMDKGKRRAIDFAKRKTQN